MKLPEWWNSSKPYKITDCIEGMQSTPDVSVDLIFADPPFNLGKKYGQYDDNRDDYNKWCKEWLGECVRILKNTGSIYIMNIQENIWIFQSILNDYNSVFRNIIAWKNSSTPIKNRYCINYQPIIFYTKSDNYTFNSGAEKHDSKAALPWGRKNKGNLMIDIWYDIPFISGGCMASKEAILNKEKKSKVHPCQMPIRLAERIIKFSSNENDIVLDPFLGIGTTLIACRRTNRIGLGFEIEEKYEPHIVKRLAQSRLEV